MLISRAVLTASYARANQCTVAPIYTTTHRLNMWMDDWIEEIFIVLVLPISLITGYVSIVTRCVSHVEQDRITRSQNLSSTPIFSCVRVTRSLVFCVMFYRLMVVFLFSLCCLSFGYSFWLHLWYDQSLLHRKRVDIFNVHAIHLRALSNTKELKYSLMHSVKLLACRLDSFSPS